MHVDRKWHEPWGTSAGALDDAQAAGGLPVAVTTIDQFYASRHCIVCDASTPAKQPICAACQQSPQLTTAILTVLPPLSPMSPAHIQRTFLSACTHTGIDPNWDLHISEFEAYCQSRAWGRCN